MGVEVKVAVVVQGSDGGTYVVHSPAQYCVVGLAYLEMDVYTCSFHICDHTFLGRRRQTRLSTHCLLPWPGSYIPCVALLEDIATYLGGLQA